MCPLEHCNFSTISINFFRSLWFIKPWAKKCAETIERAKELNQEIEIDLLVPLATPRYYWDFIHGKCTSEFLKKRLKFIDFSGKIKKVGDFRKDCWIHHYTFKPEK